MAGLVLGRLNCALPSHWTPATFAEILARDLGSTDLVGLRRDKETTRERVVVPENYPNGCLLDHPIGG